MLDRLSSSQDPSLNNVCQVPFPCKTCLHLLGIKMWTALLADCRCFGEAEASRKKYSDLQPNGGLEEEEWLHFAQRKSKSEQKFHRRKIRGSWKCWILGGTWLMVMPTCRLLTFLGHLGNSVTVISPRTELLLQGSYPFHAPPHPSSGTYIHTQGTNQRQTSQDVFSGGMDHLKIKTFTEWKKYVFHFLIGIPLKLEFPSWHSG